MKKGLIILFSCALLLGCEPPAIDLNEPTEPTVIEGLDIRLTELPEGGIWSIQFLSEMTGFISGIDGRAYKTTDGGLTWNKLDTKTDFILKKIQFINENEGWALVGDKNCVDEMCSKGSPAVLRTTDGGVTWVELSSKILENTPTNFWFVNSSLGFMVGPDYILRTTNGGEGWTKVFDEHVGSEIMSVKFYDELHGIVTSWKDNVIVTSDGGDSWTVQAPFNAFEDRSNLSLTENNVAYIVTSSNVYKSNNRGQSWSNISTLSYMSNSVNFISESKGFTVGAGEYSGGDFGRWFAAVYYTTDGGVNWKGTARFHEVNELRSASFPTPTTFYATDGTTLVRLKFK